LMEGYGIGSQCRQMFVTVARIPSLVSLLDHRDPDVLSLDIDGNDCFIARALLDADVRPKILVVEYNAVFGPEQCVTVPYRQDFDFRRAHRTELYYGVSVAGWRKLLEPRGYRFVTVESCGVNAFFVDPTCFEPGFLDGVSGHTFVENRYQRVKFGMAWDKQLELIGDQALERL